MRNTAPQSLLLSVSLLTSLCGTSFRLTAQTLAYSQDFDVDTASEWVVNMTGSSNRVDFHFDYSTAGIPAAPHSAGGITFGLKLQTNLDPTPGIGVFPSGVSVSPTGFSITENFEMRFDLWINFNGPLPAGGSGSTQVGGAGYGTAGLAPQVAGGGVDSVFIGATGDGGSSADYRVYTPNKGTSYQDADRVIASDPSSPLVYAAGSRNNSASYYTTNFPGSPVPAAQTALYPNQTGTSANGAIGMKWRDVALKKVGNTITYRIDGVLIATINAIEAGTLGGANILFSHFDINAGASTDPNAPQVAFTLIDNVRITNFPNIVAVETSQADAAEAGPTPGQFTISRTAAGTSQTILYALSGTAANGEDFATLPGSVTFPSSATSVDVTITPIDDSLSEPRESVTLTILEGPGYVGSGSATLSIADNDPQVLRISALSPSIYEPSLYDRARFRISRLGDLNSSAVIDVANVVTSGLGGTANPARFNVVGLPAQLDPGAESVDVDLVAPINDSILQGTETITVGLASGADFTVTADTATISILDDEFLQPERVVFSDALTGDSRSRWKLAFAANNALEDYTVAWGYSLADDSIPNAPSGSSTALKLTVNKDEGSLDGAAALNLYLDSTPLNRCFSVRFNMYLTTSGGGTTEYALMGINHSGESTNWLIMTGSGPVLNKGSDGFWFAVCGDGSGSAPGDYVLFRGNGPTAVPVQLATTSAASLVNVFKSPPFEFAGALDNAGGSATPTWADVEIRRNDNTVSLRINNTPIITYATTNNYTGGKIMLGYMDPYASIGAGGAVYYSNLRVVDLTPVITSISHPGANFEISFSTGDLLDTPATVKIQSADQVTGLFADDPSATVIQVSPGSFRATIPANGNIRFYRIRR